MRGVRGPCGEEAATLEVTGLAPLEVPVTEAIEVLDGDIATFAKRLIVDARAEVCVVAMAGMLWDLPDPSGPARWRVLLSTGASAGALGTSDGCELRWIAAPPVGAVIVDRSVALVRAGRMRGGDVTLLVHPGGLLQAVQALFERTWSAAQPGRFDRSVGRPCRDDLQLLRLLLDGFTDEAIASRLEVGARTVQRRVHDLIEAAGVRTRLQLIWHATRRGWI